MRGIHEVLVALLLLLAPTLAAAEEPEIEAPAEAVLLDVAAGEFSRPDGVQGRWTSVVYELTAEHDAEMFVEIDDLGRGSGTIYVDGEALIRVVNDENGDATTWIAPSIELPPEELAQLVPMNVADEIFAGIGDSLAFECSDFGKGVVRAAKYLWVGLSTAAGAACCLGTASVGCIVCAGAAGAAGAMGSDIADDYCE